jgi:hypothetical protein
MCLLQGRHQQLVQQGWQPEQRCQQQELQVHLGQLLSCQSLQVLRRGQLGHLSW